MKKPFIRFYVLCLLSYLAVHSVSYAWGEISSNERLKIEQAVPARATAIPKHPRKLLVTNLNKWDGAVRPGHLSIPYGNLALELMGKKTGAYATVFSDDVEMFRPANLSQFDAVCFNNTVGVLFEDPALRKSLLDFVHAGKGFVGIHAAGATFVQWPKYDQWPEFGEMLGGYENGGHPWKPDETITIKLDDPTHPVNAAFHGRGFEISDEVFQFQAPYSRDKLHVLLSIDTTKTDMNPRRRILPERQKDGDLAISWVRNFGDGRVFYTSLGHNSHIYWTAPVLQHLLAGIQFAMGDLEAETTPSGQLVSSGVGIKSPTSLSLTEVDTLLDKMAGYEYGQSREPLVALSDLVRDAVNSKSSLRELELRFLAFLNSKASLAGKDFVCRQLSLIGTDASVPVLAAMLSGPGTADMARYALERIPGEAVNLALRQALQNSSEKQLIGTINTLGQRRDRESVSSLRPLISHKSSSVAAATIAALAAISGPQAAAILKEGRASTSGALREQITNAYLQCADRLASTGDRPSALSIYRQLNDPSEASLTRIAALQGLASSGDSELSTILANTLKSQDPKVQPVALRLLSTIPGPAATDQLVAEYPRLNVNGQALLLACLSERGDAKAVPLLTEAVRTNEAVEVRVEALRGLGLLGNPSSTRLLAETAATRGGAERDAARESLYRLGGKEVDQTILTELEKASPKVKAELIRAAGERSIEAATGPLLATAQDSNTEVRRESLRALRELAGPQHVPTLIDLLSSAKTDSERNEAERALSAAIKKSEKTSVNEILAAYPRLQEVPVQCSLLRVLGSVGNNDGLPLLRQQLKSTDPDLRRSAILAITDWPSDDPREDLLSIAREDGNAAHQVLALRGFIKLVSIPGARPAEEP